jgi:hypothetical protein
MRQRETQALVDNQVAVLCRSRPAVFGRWCKERHLLLAPWLTTAVYLHVILEILRSVLLLSASTELG